MHLQEMKSFVSFQVDYWDGPWQNRQGFLSELAKRAKVLFVSPPLHFEQVIRPRTKQRTLMRGLQRIDQNLWSYVPPRVLPVNHRFPRVERAFQKARAWRLNTVRQRLSFHEPATVVFHPSALPDDLANLARPLIYYKYDHYAGYGGVSAEEQRFFDPKERVLFSAADMIFVTSAGLAELHREDAPGRIQLLPNGVDYPAFLRTRQMNLAPPEQLLSIPRPRLGYFGQLNEKVDFRLLRCLAQNRRNYSFVLAGRFRSQSRATNAMFEELLSEPNVYFLGSKPHKDVPRCLVGLDVGLMPYVITEWVRFGYPLKLHEYLAAGLPSVSSKLPELVPFAGVVKLVETTDDWLAAIDEAISVRNAPDLLEKRYSIAQANSWAVRVDSFISSVEALGFHSAGGDRTETSDRG